MITVRFPTGVTATYADANYVTWSHDGQPHRLFTQKDGRIIAGVPSNAIVEFSEPLKFENPIDGPSASAAIRVLTRDDKTIRTAPAWLVATLKKLLTDFNAKQMKWRDQ